MLPVVFPGQRCSVFYDLIITCFSPECQCQLQAQSRNRNNPEKQRPYIDMSEQIKYNILSFIRSV